MAAEMQMPPGFRFHPTDDELVTHYLCRKCASLDISVPIIKEIDLYKYDPWELPGLALYGEKEWYFFSPRDRKYPNGSRPNRAAGSGYWKATGADKPIGQPRPVGIKKALVFYAGKAPRGEKTNWIMHEYRLADVDRSARKKNNSLRLDDWVLCRIYNKKGTLEKPNGVVSSSRQMVGASPPEVYEQKPEILSYGGLLHPPPPAVNSPVGMLNELADSDSVPRMHTESSCSEQVASPAAAAAAGLKYEKEVQSEPSKLSSWERAALDNAFNYMDATMDVEFPSQFQSNQMSPLQDIFMYLHKPF